MRMEISGRSAQRLPVSMGRPQRGVHIAGNPTRDHQPVDLIATPAHLDREGKEVLLVDPDFYVQQATQEALRAMAVVEAYSDFWEARARLLAKPPNLLVTNVRLNSHNGLHLVHLAPERTVCVVYGTDEDLPLAREAQAAGAFFVRTPRLPHVLQSFVMAELPTRDRRDAAVVDRREPFRGGRRCIDS